jgi:hypothetical protein
MDLRRKIKVTVSSMPTAEPRPQEEEVRDHVKQAWEKIKTDQTNEEAGDDQEPADDDVKMEESPEEQQQDQDDMDQKPYDDDLDAVERDFRGQDEVDKYINEQGEETDAVDEVPKARSTLKNFRSVRRKTLKPPIQPGYIELNSDQKSFRKNLA